MICFLDKGFFHGESFCNLVALRTNPAALRTSEKWCRRRGREGSTTESGHVGAMACSGVLERLRDDEEACSMLFCTLLG